MSIPATMRALQQTTPNGPQDLRLITDAPVPVPGPGEVLIQVAAAGVNFGDVAQAHGTFRGGPRPPYLAGFEAAGEPRQRAVLVLRDVLAFRISESHLFLCGEFKRASRK